MSQHVSVLPAEVLHYLNPGPGQVLVDLTCGLGGHTRLLAEAVGPAGRVLALDRDPKMLELASPQLAGLPVTLIRSNFDRLEEVLREENSPSVDGVLADLGVCSAQLDEAERGFSFQQDGPLDMRMGPDELESAGQLLRRLNERDLADVIYQLGEERFSRRIARKIVEARGRTPLETTEQLAEIVRRCVPWPKGRRPAIDPATRVFQALRIAVNDELGALERLLQALPRCLKPGAAAVLISFHSLEDRRVKQAFRDRNSWNVLTRKPVQAGDAEIERNPRSRSAKLRAARRIGEHPATEGGDDDDP